MNFQTLPRYEDLPPSLCYRHGDSRQARPNTPDFTPREMQTLYLTIVGRTRKEIAAQLQLSTHTIDDYRRSLFRKVQVRNSTCLVRYAINAGWVGAGAGGGVGPQAGHRSPEALASSRPGPVSERILAPSLPLKRARTAVPDSHHRCPSPVAARAR